MQLGMIGLGRMGGNIVRRLMRHGHTTVVYDANPESVAQLASEGATPSQDLQSLVAQLAAPRAVWVMLPAGEITASTIHALADLLSPEDIVIDGGNSNFQDDVRHAQMLKAKGIRYLDVGTSGGVWGLERGYCMMMGGDRSAATHLDPIFRALAPGEGSIPKTPGREGKVSTAEQGYLYTGPAGSGHFVKMIHNGIEYGMMAAFAEGLAIFEAAKDHAPGYDIDIPAVTEVWRRGSVVASWLLDLTAQALVESNDLDEYATAVSDSGEGRWTVEAAIDTQIPAPVLSAALWSRFASRGNDGFSNKALNAMRYKFGGHNENPRKGS